MSNGGIHLVTTVANGTMHDWQWSAAMNYTRVLSIVTQTHTQVSKMNIKLTVNEQLKALIFNHVQRIVSFFSIFLSKKSKMPYHHHHHHFISHSHTHYVPFQMQCSQKHAIFMHWNEVNLHTLWRQVWIGIIGVGQSFSHSHSQFQESAGSSHKKATTNHIHSRIKCSTVKVLASICFCFSARHMPSILNDRKYISRERETGTTDKQW